MEISIEPYPELKTFCFKSVFDKPIGQLSSPDWLVDLLRLDAKAPVRRSEELRLAVRDLLRHKGYKPTGRGKPASEYLVRAAEQEKLGSINVVVDACNVVSLHSGFPISVVDLDRSTGPWTIKPGESDVSYVFNRSGQEINVAGLLCLHDADGPCANAVKDAQRTKTCDDTTQTLTIIWGLEAYQEQLDQAFNWYRDLLHRLDAKVEQIA